MFCTFPPNTSQVGDIASFQAVHIVFIQSLLAHKRGEEDKKIGEEKKMRRQRLPSGHIFIIFGNHA